MVINIFKKSSLMLGVTTGLLCTALVGFANISVSIMAPQAKSFSSDFSLTKARQLIKQHVLPKLDQSKYLKIQVKPVYKAHQLQYFLVYLLSNRTFSFETMKVNLDRNMNFVSMAADKKLSGKELEQASDNLELGHCPSEVIDFVVASPLYSDIPTTKEALDNIAMLAQDRGYHVMKLYDRDATVQSYKNYLSCPRLRGFFSVAHGTLDQILLDDGVLTNEYFQQLKSNKIKAMSNAVIEFNSCEVFNAPLSIDIISFAGAQQFIGGNTSLVIGNSESASNCFWTEALMGNHLSVALTRCQNMYDSEDSGLGYGRDIFAIGGFGPDTLRAPS